MWEKSVDKRGNQTEFGTQGMSRFLRLSDRKNSNFTGCECSQPLTWKIWLPNYIGTCHKPHQAATLAILRQVCLLTRQEQFDQGLVRKFPCPVTPSCSTRTVYFFFFLKNINIKLTPLAFALQLNSQEKARVKRQKLNYTGDNMPIRIYTFLYF